MRYIARIGINYTPVGAAAEKRAEPGDIVDDLSLPPAGIAKWVERGWLEPVPEPAVKIAPGGGD